MLRDRRFAAALCTLIAVFPAAAEAQEPPSCAGVPATIVGTSGDDRLVGTPGDDVIVALEGSDRISALGGRDLVCTGPGVVGPVIDRDVVDPGDGDDHVVGSQATDVVRAGPGDDLIEGGDGHDVLEGGDGADNLTGGPGNDRLDGAGDGDYLAGEDGNDAIDAGDGGGYASGGPGRDRLTAAGERAAVEGGLGPDVLVGGTAGGQYLDGGPGADDVTGGGGSGDFVGGGAGDDTVTAAGGDGAYLGGGPGDDRLTAGAGDQALGGGDGQDVVSGGPGADSVSGEGGLDQLDGGPGPDVLQGGDDNDLLNADDDEPDTALLCGDGTDKLLADDADAGAAVVESCETDRTRFAMVALGDSYSSGEGTYDYDAHDAAQICHRGPRAWPRLLQQASVAIATIDHRACTGAVTANVWRTTEQQLPAVSDPTVDLVTLTIGGNDVGFKKMLVHCYLTTVVTRRVPGCQTRLDRTLARLPTLAARLRDDVYPRVAAAYPNARIVHAGYPRIFPRPGTDPDNCLWLTPAEQTAAETLVGALNTTIRDAAAADGRIEFADVTNALTDRELCTPSSWMVPIVPTTDTEPAHPTVQGQRTLMEAVASAVGIGLQPEF